MKKIFRYEAVNLRGEKIKGHYDYSIEELNLLLKKRGYFLCSVEKRKKDLKEIGLKKPSSRDFSNLCRILGSMITVGIPIPKVLSITEELSGNVLLKRSLKEIGRYVSKGQSIYESMKTFGNIYPIFLLEMIRIGEESGRLDLILKQLSEYYENEHKIFTKIKTALTYPLIVLILSIFVSVFLMVKIVPQFIDILNLTGGEVPFITKVVLSVCSFFKRNFLVISFTNLIIIILILRFSKTSTGKGFIAKVKLTTPLVDRIYNKAMLARFSMAMGMLLRSGINVVKSLEITTSILENRIIEQRIQNTIEQINKGDGIHSSFVKAKVGNNLFLSLVYTGEEIGNLDYMFLKIGELLAQDVEQSMKKIIIFIEPVAILILTMVIGTFIITALSPVFSIMDGMG
ncbi:type II secretion system F family protein [Clostridium sp. CX1]|uniref:type II secretion system F family protein n=1 Tax=Clostridium sp. CX1 TaxID=2978346 RepID=UPI0021C1A20E|nr:type II secretion system F family protein [Clostridium sp. CX1]MCT8976050.1 type II secretion system F family protein [Clostridium sp. CX1]